MNKWGCGICLMRVNLNLSFLPKTGSVFLRVGGGFGMKVKVSSILSLVLPLLFLILNECPDSIPCHAI